MKPFLFKICFFLFFIVSFFGVLFSFMFFKSPENSTNWFYGVNSGLKPRIILVGASNVYTNYDYVMLNNSFSEYDVLGAHMPASVGFIPLISNLEPLKLTSDDIVIFCMPYQLFDPGFFINFYDELPQQVLSRNSIIKAFEFYPTQAFKNFLAINVKSYFRYLTNSKANTSFTNDLPKINKDQVNLLKIPDYLNCKTSEEANFSIVSDSFDKLYLSNFMYSLKRDIKSHLYFRFPAVHKNNVTINMEKIDFFNEEYDFINEYYSTIYDSIYWYDNKYHLNKCGAVKNTELFIGELHDVLDNM